MKTIVMHVSLLNNLKENFVTYIYLCV